HLHRARGIVGVDVVAGLDGVVIGSCLTGATGAADSPRGHGGGAGDAGHETAGTGGSHDGITPLRRAVRRLRRGFYRVRRRWGARGARRRAPETGPGSAHRVDVFE